MKTTEPRAIHLKDYRPPPYRIPELALDFNLDPEATRVTATMKVERVAERGEPLQLDGHRLKLISVKVNGAALDKSAYVEDATSLTLTAPPASFTLELVTEIAPAETGPTQTAERVTDQGPDRSHKKHVKNDRHRLPLYPAVLLKDLAKDDPVSAQAASDPE